MKEIRELRIFLGSPMDVEVERTIVQEVIDEINITYGTPNNLNVKLVNWENYSFPAIGEDPQDVINKQVPYDYDVFLCIFWTRIGTRTYRSRSGTIEELEIAHQKVANGENVEIMGYFKTEHPQSLKDITEEYFEVRNLQKEFGKTGLYKEYTSTDKFKDIFRINFTQYLNARIGKLGKPSKSIEDLPAVIDVGNKKRLEIYNKLSSLNLDLIGDSDLMDTIDIISSKTEQLTFILDDVTNNVGHMNDRVRRATDEMNIANRISDNRLRTRKQKIVVNQLANDLDIISDKYDLDLPMFKETYLELINSLVRIYKVFESYMSEPEKESKKEMIDSIDGTIESLADLLVEMSKVPKLTSKYGQAQIRQMKLLKGMTEELLFGRELLDEIE
ncbi:MAG: hypothetical protein IPL46_02180 [Saprospiraceae bacterium]|nr:hypothetical protein [Saprospiraceae bacterium]